MPRNARQFKPRVLSRAKHTLWPWFLVTVIVLWLTGTPDPSAQVDSAQSAREEAPSEVNQEPEALDSGGNAESSASGSGSQTPSPADLARRLTEEYAFEEQPIAQQSFPSAADPELVGDVAPDHRLEATRLQVQAEIEELHKETAHKMRRDGLQYGIAMALIVAVPLTVGILLWALMRHKHASTVDLINGAGLVLIIFAIIFVVVVADNEQQLTTSIGVLGTIAGYLFGSYVGARRNE